MDPELAERIGRYAGPMLTASLQAASRRQNMTAQQNLGRPQSVLSQIGLSPLAQNASAPSMSDRYNEFTGTVLPNTMTGASEGTAQTALKLRFAGQERVDDE